MENSMLVQVDECEQDLVQEELCLLFGEWLIALLLHVFLQVELQILKDQVQLVLTVDDLLKPVRKTRIVSNQLISRSIKRNEEIKLWIDCMLS